MRIPEKYQNFYFFLQEMETKLHELDDKNDLRKCNDKELDNIDKQGINLVREVKRLLNDINEFSPYNDLESIWGETSNELKINIEKRYNELKTLVESNKKGQRN